MEVGEQLKARHCPAAPAHAALLGVPYERPSRLEGASKYSVRDRVKLAVDGLVFRTGWYAGWMHPDSSTGHYERLIVHEREQSKAGGKRVLVLGDSTSGSGSLVEYLKTL